jgi:hypothetical protein
MCQDPQEGGCKMEAIREHNVEAINFIQWEGMDFELREPEITFERARVEREQKPRMTANQKRLIEDEHFVHTLP